MTKGRPGEMLITTKELREKFALCDEQFIESGATSYQTLDHNDVPIIWVRVWDSVRAYQERDK